jgi:hypothetical protein
MASEARLASFDDLFGYSRLAGQTAAGDDIPTILNLAATAETLACTHYYNVLTEGTIALNTDEQNILKSALDAEIQHLVFLNANGGTTLATEFFFPRNVYTDREQFSEITEQSEAVFVAAYLAAVRRIAELGNPLLAATAAQVAVTEQAHLALVRQIGGRRPNPGSLGKALVYNTSDAVPILQPFLEGGEDRIGPKTFPGVDAINDLIGDVGVSPVRPFTDPALFTTGGPAAVTGDCSVTTAGNVRVNIREAAGISNKIIDKLPPGDNQAVNGKRTDSDGFVWFRLNKGGFVRSDVVKASGNCPAVPDLP